MLPYPGRGESWGRSDLTAAVDSVLERLARASADLASTNRPTSLLYSGGLDSSLVAHLMPRSCALVLESIGARGAPDLAAASEGAAALARPYREHTIGESDVATAMTRWRSELLVPEPYRSVRTAVVLALERAQGPVVLCGQGADELFLGYAHYERLSSEGAHARRDRDLTRLTREDWPSAERTARELGLRLGSPFLDARLVEAVRALPIEWLAPKPTQRKPFLRAVARRAGLPVLLAERPKRALQYGSGVAKLVRARGERIDRASATGPVAP